MHIRTQLKPGDIGYIIYLHGVLYDKEYGLDSSFEGLVAERIGAFAKTYDRKKDYLAIAEIDGRIVGSIAIVTQDVDSAQLRWFLVHPDARGTGLGKRLITEAVEFCRSRDFKSVFLWTLKELTVAGHLYRAMGFKVVEEKTHELWGGIHTEQTYELKL